MPIEHRTPDTPPAEVAGILARDGCVVIDALASSGEMARVHSEMQPYLDAASGGSDVFSGRATRRVGGLVPRSAASRALITHPTILGVVGRVLAHATAFQLHLTQVIAIGPGETEQAVHRDQWAFDFFPFPKGYEVQCNTIWAMTDFREHNGATRVVPGSHHFEDRLELSVEDTECAEMDAGSVLLYTGSLYHGGGANRSDAVRLGLNITYATSWLRQEENQYLTTPLEVARELPEDLLRLMGYQRGAYALGYVDDLRDPMAVVNPGFVRRDGLGDLERARARVRAD
jgi:hypothetical protein